MSTSEMRFTRAHCWVRLEGGQAVVGITDYAQEQMSELTFVELPEVGEEVEAEDEVAVVESVKAASDVYSPVGGKVVEVNAALADKPETIKNRLKVYLESTRPLRDYYLKSGKYRAINGSGSVERIFDDIARAIDSEN